MKKISLLLVLLLLVFTGCQSLSSENTTPEIISIDESQVDENPLTETPSSEPGAPADESEAVTSSETTEEEQTYSYIEGITLTKLDGTTVEIEDYRGKYVILNFWASW